MTHTLPFLRLSTGKYHTLLVQTMQQSVEMSLRLARYFGTSSKFWFNMQNELDLREAQKKIAKDLDKIPRCQKTA